MTENGAPAARTEICVVGAGPRGISVTERLLANARQRGPSAGRLVVHLVDPMLGAGGRVWSVDQPDVLLMNTIASQITMFTDESVICEGPVVRGPSLYEWARSPLTGEPPDGFPPGRPGPDRRAAGRTGGPAGVPVSSSAPRRWPPPRCG